MLDVVVVGGGPAGATAAYLLAGEGYRVALLEKERYPRRKPCGGGLTQRSLKILRELGLYSEDYVLHRTRRAEIVFYRAGKRVTVDARIAMTTREAFDSYLARRAAEAGAELHEGERAVRIEAAPGRVRVATPRGVYEARAAVIAAGHPSPLAAMAGIRPRYRLAVAYEFDAQPPPGADAETSYFYMNLEERFAGYFWIFPKGGFANYGGGSWAETMKGILGRHGGYREWLMWAASATGFKVPGLEEAVKRAEGHLLPAYNGSQPAHLVGDSVIAVGDSAGLVNALGEGISSALASARVAARTLAEQLSSGGLSRGELLAAAGPRLRREVLDDLSVTPRLVSAMERLPRTIAALVEEDAEARRLLGAMIDYSMSFKDAYRRLAPKMLKHLGTALSELLRPGTP